MSKFQYLNELQYICSSCNNKCSKYFIYSEYELAPHFFNNLNDFLERLKYSQKILQFLCCNCYNKKILNLKIVQQTFSDLSTNINQAESQILIKNKQINELNIKIQQTTNIQNHIFSFNEIQNQYRELESYIKQLQTQINNGTAQANIEQLQEALNFHNLNGLIKISKQFEDYLSSNITQTKANIRKIQQVNQQIQSIYGDMDSQEVTSKIKMQEFINNEIQSQNLENKIELLKEINKFMERLERKPQTLKADEVKYK